MPEHPFSPRNAPYGADAPASDWYVLAAPSIDTVLTGPGRAFVAVSAGTVSVRPRIGGPVQTFNAQVGFAVAGTVAEVMSATTADLIIYSDTGE